MSHLFHSPTHKESCSYPNNKTKTREDGLVLVSRSHCDYFTCFRNFAIFFHIFCENTGPTHFCGPGFSTPRLTVLFHLRVHHSLFHRNLTLRGIPSIGGDRHTHTYVSSIETCDTPFAIAHIPTLHRCSSSSHHPDIPTHLF